MAYIVTRNKCSYQYKKQIDSILYIYKTLIRLIPYQNSLGERSGNMLINLDIKFSERANHWLREV